MTEDGDGDDEDDEGEEGYGTQEGDEDGGEYHGGYETKFFIKKKKKINKSLAKVAGGTETVLLDLFVKILRDKQFGFEWDEDKFRSNGMKFSCLTNRTLQRKVAQIRPSLLKTRDPNFMIKHCLKPLLRNQSTSTLLQQAGFKIPEDILPATVAIRNIYCAVKDDMLQSRRGPDRHLCITAAVSTVQRAQLTAGSRGDVQLLREALGSSWEYAAKILRAVDSGDTESLYTYKTRRDALKFSPWPRLLKDFAKDPINSRSCPGHSTVSLKYGVRADKYLLRRPMKVIISAFLIKYPDCNFAPKTLMREWPGQLFPDNGLIKQ